MMPCREEPGQSRAAGGGGSLKVLRGFRAGVHGCFARRADSLFDLVDAVLATDGRVRSLAELSLQRPFRRGHGALYDAVASGEIDVPALAGLITSVWEPLDDGPLKFAIDVSSWHRPHAECARERHHCHHSCACGNRRGTVPGWPYSVAVGLEWGAHSWCAPLDARRLAVAEDATAVTVAQVEAVLERCAAAGLSHGRPAALFVFDSGYDLTRIAYLTAGRGLERQILGRVRRDRVYYGDPVPRPRGAPGRPPVHGRRFAIADPGTWHDPDLRVERDSPRCGRTIVTAWHGLHQKLERQGAWREHAQQLPRLPGTLIRVQTQRLPGGRAPQDLWLWHHARPGTGFDLDQLWTAYLRRFDIEHTFRFFKQSLGWTAPQVGTPEQADRWTWLTITAYTQLRLARRLGAHLRLPWQRPTPPDRIPTPGRVRRGFPVLARKIGTPAAKPKPTTAGPGRPTGTTRPPRTRHPAGKKTGTSHERATSKTPDHDHQWLNLKA